MQDIMCYKCYKCYKLKENTKEFRHLEVIMICGPQDCEVKNKAILESGYIVKASDLVYKVKPWNSYNQEKTICITGFIDNKKTPIKSSIIDGYQCRLNIKNSCTYANWDKVYITTNIQEETLENLKNNELYQGFFRRITQIIYTWPKIEDFEIYVPNRPYQFEILDIIKSEPDNRSIYWYVGNVDKVGETDFFKYLCSKHDALMLSDKLYTFRVKNAINKWKKSKGDVPKLIIYTSKSAVQAFGRYYECLEICKDMCFSYKGKNIIGNSPHLIIFSNEPPDMSKINIDRWKVFEIDHNSFKTSSWVG